MARLRVRREIAERVIAHKPEGVEAIYDRYEYLEEKREALAQWEAEIIRVAVEEDVAQTLQVPPELSDEKLAARATKQAFYPAGCTALFASKMNVSTLK
jgi:hypothetical protein